MNIRTSNEINETPSFRLKDYRNDGFFNLLSEFHTEHFILELFTVGIKTAYIAHIV